MEEIEFKSYLTQWLNIKKIWKLNAQSLIGKINILKTYVCDLKPSIVCISEACTNSSMSDAFLTLDNYVQLIVQLYMLNVFFLQFCPLIKYSQRYLFLCKLRKLNNHFSPDPSSSTCDQNYDGFWKVANRSNSHLVNWSRGQLALSNW